MDTGSTHTFIHLEVAQCRGLPIMPRDSLSVLVTNGDHECSLGVCTVVDVSIHDEHFTIDCFALDLGTFDLVLGIRWL